MMDWDFWFETQPLLAICLTVTAYSVADMIWTVTGRPALLNPVLTATTMLAGILLVCGIQYHEYLSHAGPIVDTLPVIVVLLAVPLCRQFRLILHSRGAMVAGLLSGGLVCVVSALIVPITWNSENEIIATIAPKSATTAVAYEISERLGGLSSLTAVIVIATGIFGGAFGPAILDRAGIFDERARGLALGVTSHAIGTARAFQSSDTAGAFASMGMILNAILTIILAPLAYEIAVAL